MVLVILSFDIRIYFGFRNDLNADCGMRIAEWFECGMVRLRNADCGMRIAEWFDCGMRIAELFK